MGRSNGWPELFASAFGQSRNAMVLLDERRRIVNANAALTALVGRARSAVIGRPVFEIVARGALASEREWQANMDAGHFTGVVSLVDARGAEIPVQWGATTEVVTGRRLVLVVALSTSRWGPHFRHPPEPGFREGTLSAREREVVRLVALGDTGPEIAAELGISHDTVRTHVRNAMAKVGARSRAHLVAKAIGDGLVDA